MFKIDVLKGVYTADTTLCAKAASLENAMAFVREFLFDGMITAAFWTKHEKRYVMEVYDWYDLWFANPLALARITAPAGFVPCDPANSIVGGRCRK